MDSKWDAGRLFGGFLDLGGGVPSLGVLLLLFLSFAKKKSGGFPLFCYGEVLRTVSCPKTPNPAPISTSLDTWGLVGPLECLDLIFTLLLLLLWVPMELDNFS